MFLNTLRIINFDESFWRRATAGVISRNYSYVDNGIAQSLKTLGLQL